MEPTPTFHIQYYTGGVRSNKKYMIGILLPTGKITKIEVTNITKDWHGSIILIKKFNLNYNETTTSGVNFKIDQ